MKTPIIPFFFLLMGIASCTHSPQPEDLIIPNPDVDSVIIADSSGNRNETPQKTVAVVNATNEKLSDTERFLLNPFDLYRFKKKVGQSNSGSGDKKGYFFKPQKKVGTARFSYSIISNATVARTKTGHLKIIMG